jgi:acylglycerol lipase
MADGYRLPLRHWGDMEHPWALVLALHGFNDYGNAFADLGPYLATLGILTYAYDQRGFGATAQRGHWGGEERMIGDLQTLMRLLRASHPGVPMFLLGESMGGAVVIAAATARERADGVILIAPAVWSRDTMSPVQRLVLELMADAAPWLELTGSGLGIRPSDNLAMLRAFSADPMVIKETRVDAIWGLTNMMDRAMSEGSSLSGPVLLLYGEKDEIVPGNAFCTFLARLPKGQQGIRKVLYHNGWHMLTRDLQGKRVMADIAAWLTDRNASLPSGEEVRPGSSRLEDLCHT